MVNEQAVLQVNEAFYAAFTNADLEAMIEVWAHDDQIACTHPGWDALTGYHDVMESWRAILEGATAPQISCRDARAFLFGDVAFVTCNEVVNGGLLVATNFFTCRNETWLMVHHHAGPCAATGPATDSAPPGSVH